MRRSAHAAHGSPICSSPYESAMAPERLPTTRSHIHAMLSDLACERAVQKRIPALPNALKYSISMLVVLFGAVHPTIVAAAPDAYYFHVAWVAVYLVSTLYTFAWDVIMDWKLGNLKEGMLRPRRMFTQRWLYYAAMITDLVLRFAWTATLVPHWIAVTNSTSAMNTHLSVLDSQYILPCITIGELCRRAMWACLRLESEHLHNTEGFRRVEVVPLHFDHSREDPDKTAQPSKRIETVVELLVYAAVVAILAAAAYFDPIGGDDGAGAPQL